MNVVVQINGRDAIPVRAIPLLTDWEVLSPDVCANAFAGDEDTAQSFEGLPTYRLNSSGEPEAIEARWWANWIVRELAACSELCGEGEAGYRQWRRESLPLLPAGVFVWRDEFELAYQREYGPDSMRARFSEGDYDASAPRLNFEPAHGPREDWRELVMEGFALGPKPSRDGKSKWATVEPAGLVTANDGTPSKLTDSQKRSVVELYNRGRGESVAALSRAFGVSRRTIDKVLGAANLKTENVKRRTPTTPEESA